MKKAPSKVLRAGVALAFAVTLFLTGNTRITVQAHSAAASLPTLRMTYWASKNKLARHLDPALINATNEADTAELANANLLVIGTDNRPHLSMATKLIVSKDHKTYTFDINPKARFSNGHPVTAADVVFSVKRALDPKTASSVAPTYLGVLVGATEFNAGKSTSLPGVKAVGKLRVQFKITKPYAYFLDTLAYPTSDVLDPAVVAGKTSSAQNNYLTNNCPGNQGAGQFKFVCFGSGFFPAGQTPSYTLVPNPYYFGHKAHIKIVMHAYDTADTVYKAYQAGQEDVAGIPSAHLSQWLKSPQHHAQPTSAVFYLNLNIKSAPFSDVNCRRAVAYGIDRATIDNKVLHHTATPLYTVVPKGFLGYYNSKLDHYSLKTAQSYFSKCSLKSTPVTLKYPTGSSDADNEYAATTNMLQRIGFNVKQQGLDENDWLNVVTNPLTKTSTQIISNGWQQDYPDPQDYFENLLSCDVQGPGPASYNIQEWCNSTFNSLDKKADLEPNKAKRAKLYQEMDRIVISNASYIPQENSVSHFLIKPYVHGLITTVSQIDVTAKNLDWSTVSIKH